MYKNLIIAIAIFGLLFSVAYVSQADSPAQEPAATLNNTSQQGNLSTPQLIKAALERGEIDEDTAHLYMAYALGNYDNLPARYRSQVPWHGTLPLFQLENALKTMKTTPKRAKIVEILSGTCGSSSASLPTMMNTPHFHIEYGSIGGGLSITEYSDSLETSWETEITDFGWAAPPVLTGNPPPGNLYHVRIDDLGGGLYGYVTTGGEHAGFVGDNPNTAWNDSDAYASCMVLNNDYSGFPGTPQRALDATTAHEFNHSIQFGYGAITGANAPDLNVVEGGATWMEDEVFDASNDNYNYLWPDFNTCMGQYTPSPYPYWITWRGLTERYGTGAADAGEQVMQDFWEAISQSSSSNMFSALNTALVNQGTTLADAYHAYAVAVKFNKTCGGGFSYPYCFEEGANYVAAKGATPIDGAIATVGSSYTGNVADNYALNWVTLPTTGVYSVTLQNNSPGGQLRGSVVCDTGSTLTVNPFPAVVGASNSTILANFDPAGCNSVVAVVTNQAQTADNPSTCTPRSYRLSTFSGNPLPLTPVYLPLIMKSPTVTAGCVPQSGESDNIADALEICSGNTASGQVNDTDFDDVYKLWIEGTQRLTIVMSGSGGDADLYLYPPDTTNVITDPFVDSSTGLDNNEFIQGIASNNGSGRYWYIDVYDCCIGDGGTNYQVTATLSSPKSGTQTFTLTGTTKPRDRSQPKVPQ